MKLNSNETLILSLISTDCSSFLYFSIVITLAFKPPHFYNDLIGNELIKEKP